MTKKNPHAVALGSKGGKKRAKTQSKRRLREIAMMGVAARAEIKNAVSPVVATISKQ